MRPGRIALFFNEIVVRFGSALNASPAELTLTMRPRYRRVERRRIETRHQHKRAQEARLVVLGSSMVLPVQLYG